jgi:hypothetical protein
MDKLRGLWEDISLVELGAEEQRAGEDQSRSRLKKQLGAENVIHCQNSTSLSTHPPILTSGLGLV